MAFGGVRLGGVTWFLTYIGVRAVVERPGALSTQVQVVLVLTPVIPMALFLYYLITGMREMDELERRIQLEALAFAYPLALLLLMTLGLLEFVVKLRVPTTGATATSGISSSCSICSAW